MHATRLTPLRVPEGGRKDTAGAAAAASETALTASRLEDYRVELLFLYHSFFHHGHHLYTREEVLGRLVAVSAPEGSATRIAPACQCGR